MINFEKQFDNIESKFKDIENNLNSQSSLDTEKLIKLNREYAELTPIVETIKKYKNEKKAKYVIIVGEEEENNNNYILKNLSNGDQKAVNLNDVLHHII